MHSFRMFVLLIKFIAAHLVLKNIAHFTPKHNMGSSLSSCTIHHLLMSAFICSYHNLGNTISYFMTHIFAISFIIKIYTLISLHVLIRSAQQDRIIFLLTFFFFLLISETCPIHLFLIFLINSCILPFIPLIFLNCNLIYVMGIIWFGMRHLRRHQTWYEDGDIFKGRNLCGKFQTSDILHVKQVLQLVRHWETTEVEATAGLLEKKEENESRTHFCFCAITNQSAGVCLKWSEVQQANGQQCLRHYFQFSGKKYEWWSHSQRTENM